MKASLESIVKSSRELKAVTERLLGFTKLMEPSRQNTNLLEIFRTLFGLLERSFMKTGIQVDRRYGNVPMTWCDPGAASPPLLYMLRFALETLRAAGGGSMLLEATQEEGDLVFRVSVTPPAGAAVQETAGRPGDMTRDQAEDFAREEGGSLAVERLATGWVLTCRFPVRRSPAAQEADDRDAAFRKVAAGARAVAAPAVSVLVVEDEPAIRELIQEVLEDSECRVTLQADASAALRVFEHGRFDVVFTDISMPGMDGVTLVRKVRSIDPRAVVVVVTGRATDETVRGALNAGAKMVLRKPFEISDLRTIVHSIRTDPSGEHLDQIARDPRDMVVT